MVTARFPHSLRAWMLGLAAGGVLAGGLILAFGSTGASRAPAQHPLPPAVSPAGLAERSGVRLIRVAVSGGGGLLDVRYQIVDPGKAAALHDAGTPPAVVYEPTNTPIEGLLMGHAPHAPQRVGVTSYLVFVNPGNIVHRGDRVSVILGGGRLEHVTVR
ncbi:MAG: hypothetical protein QOD24_3443 [Solirubrobacteraceae bacterium]|jgi:hypothetical protein|nr:hypothetical protein [Solirubrobacteraceae bacterium]